jgi:hypothetical protein
MAWLLLTFKNFEERRLEMDHSLGPRSTRHEGIVREEIVNALVPYSYL